MKHDMTPEETRGFRIFLVAGGVVLAVVMLFELGIHHHAHFEEAGLKVDAAPWFFPLFGFAGSLALVIVAKTLAIALKRKDTFYADD